MLIALAHRRVRNDFVVASAPRYDPCDNVHTSNSISTRLSIDDQYFLALFRHNCTGVCGSAPAGLKLPSLGPGPLFLAPPSITACRHTRERTRLLAWTVRVRRRWRRRCPRHLVPFAHSGGDGHADSGSRDQYGVPQRSFPAFETHAARRARSTAPRPLCDVVWSALCRCHRATRTSTVAQCSTSGT